MATAPDLARASFDEYADQTNRRRIVPLSLALGGLTGLAVLVNLATTGGGDNSNYAALLMAVLQILLARTGRTRGLPGIVFGSAVLWWGASVLSSYSAEVMLRHPTHAAANMAIYILTRYFAAITVLWRPRDLALALAACHVYMVVAMAPVDPQNAYLFMGIWTATAWVAGWLIARAERDAFFARLALQHQRDELATANDHLARLNQEKNDLMAIAAHDLRSPLMAMSTMMHMAIADSERSWSGVVGTLRAVEQSCRDMAALVTRILDVHQAEDAIGQIAVAPGDVSAVVVQAAEAQRSRADAKAIRLSIEVPEDACLALHDAQALGRVLDNLLSNAVKFTPRGGSVSVRVDPSGPHATIAVADSGPGIPVDERDRLFRKFARLRARPTDGESSSGLGLYIAKRLTNAMGGTIEVRSTPGEGSTFSVTLDARAGASGSA